MLLWCYVASLPWFCTIVPSMSLKNIEVITIVSTPSFCVCVCVYVCVCVCADQKYWNIWTWKNPLTLWWTSTQTRYDYRLWAKVCSYIGKIPFVIEINTCLLMTYSLISQNAPLTIESSFTSFILARWYSSGRRKDKWSQGLYILKLSK